MLEGKKCKSCKHIYVDKVDYCTRCGSKEMEEIKFSGEGIIYSFTTIRVPPAPLKDEAPYNMGIVDLIEGPRITVRLNMPEQEMEIGQKVSLISQKNSCCVFGKKS